ncbi:Coronin-2A IR10 WD repeat-containing protein 2 [Channa argus]|uniref:Coronin n=1 Tax=Channa argus TaxID=215402 RepID=A0A6G1Q6F3_CHAAH|nr:Coronin-2A IR10 WD repeat-containing protein 2 [Channa argus]
MQKATRRWLPSQVRQQQHTAEMSWRSSFCSKFRHVFGKPATKEHGYDGVPITRSVHDNHHCSANPCFIAVVTECAGGGSFLVLPIHHTGRVDPQHPRVCGHSGEVLDVKWNPFDDHCIASCSEDCTVRNVTVMFSFECVYYEEVKIWDIPVYGVQQNLTEARKTLLGHSRRVGLIEWHPTAENLLLSSGYDYKVLLWDVSQEGAEIRFPVRVVMMPVHRLYPPEMLLLSVSFNSDGSRLAITSKDRRIRILDPRNGKILQVSSIKSHRASKVLYIGGMKMLLSTGSSPWNHRQIILWDPDDLSEPLHEEELDGAAGVLFPFYDPDTCMLYLAGKGDGNIRYYELSAEKPYISFLMEYRSLLPQKGLGVMPKRGLDVNGCEIFRFYRLIAVKDLVEPLSMIVPRKELGIFQEDLYPMTAGNQAALTAQEWLSGMNREPVLMSLKPGDEVINPYPETPAEKRLEGQMSSLRFQICPAVGAVTQSTLVLMEEAFIKEQLAYQDAKYPRNLSELSGWQPDETYIPHWTYCCTPHCCEPAEMPPPTTENELLQAFYRQQDEIRDLREELNHKEVRITQLEFRIKNTRNNMRATF